MRGLPGPLKGPGEGPWGQWPALAAAGVVAPGVRAWGFKGQALLEPKVLGRGGLVGPPKA